MPKTSFKAIFLALISLLAVACGDPGAGSFNDVGGGSEVGFEHEAGFEEEAGFENEVGFEREPRAEAEAADEPPVFEGDTPADEEPVNVLIDVPQPVFDQVEEFVRDPRNPPPFNEAQPPVFEELSEEELALIAGVGDSQDKLVERIIAGEVLVEQLDNGVVVADGLTEAEIAELLANGFEVVLGG